MSHFQQGLKIRRRGHDQNIIEQRQQKKPSPSNDASSKEVQKESVEQVEAEAKADAKQADARQTQENAQTQVLSNIPPPPPTLEGDDPKMLDFYILGFPKCGTTALMHLFKNVMKETDMVHEMGEYNKVKNEEYRLWKPWNVMRLLDEIRVLREANNLRIDPETGIKYHETKVVKKYGIKWPTGLIEGNCFDKSVETLLKANPKHKETRFIVGMRHPVRFFESFYNYRAQHKDPSTPHISKLIGNSTVAWKGLYSDLVRFERHLMSFGKFHLTSEDMHWLAHNNKTVISTPNKVFLYMQEQFNDKNVTRKQQVLDDLVTFVGANQRVTPNDLPRSNVLDHKSKAIDICNPEFENVRKHLLESGKASGKWFRTHLENANDVYVSNKEHFMDMISKWEYDPCKENKRKKKTNANKKPNAKPNGNIKKNGNANTNAKLNINASTSTKKK